MLVYCGQICELLTILPDFPARQQVLQRVATNMDLPKYELTESSDGMSIEFDDSPGPSLKQWKSLVAALKKDEQVAAGLK